MRKLLFLPLALAAMPLAGCATLPHPSAAQVSDGVVRAQAALDRLQAAADRLLPFVGEVRAAQIQRGLDAARQALAAARAAATLAEQAKALRDAEAAVTRVVAATPTLTPQ